MLLQTQAIVHMKKNEASTPQKLGLHKWIFGRNLPLSIPIGMCVNCRLCSRSQSPEFKRIINTYTSMPSMYHYFRARSEKHKKKLFPPPHPENPRHFGPTRADMVIWLWKQKCVIRKNYAHFKWHKMVTSCLPKCPLLLGRKELRIS